MLMDILKRQKQKLDIHKKENKMKEKNMAQRNLYIIDNDNELKSKLVDIFKKKRIQI